MDVTKIFPIFSDTTGYWMIAIYAVFVFMLTSWFAKGYDSSKEAFLLANRKIGFWQGSTSAGASWIHAPGLFVAAQQGYMNGWPGVFWFSLGNFFSMMVFAYFINKFRNKNDQLYTHSEFFKGKFGAIVGWLLVAQMILGTLQSLTIDLYAGSNSVTLLTGLPAILVSALLVGIALTYSLRGGIKASIITDVCKIIMIFIGTAVVGYEIFSTVGFQPVIDGMAGKAGKGTSLWSDSFALGLLFGFGIPTVIGHFASAWISNESYQNAFSMEKGVALKAYMVAPFYWLVLQIIGGPLGMIAAGLHYDISGPKTGFINIIVMVQLVGPWLALFFLVTVFSGLISIIDTMLINSANIFGNDVNNAFGGKNPILWSRVAMIVFAAIGITLANIPGLDLNLIFLIGKATQLCFFIPIVMGILFPDHVTKQGFISGSLVGVLAGSSLYIYGLFGGGPIIQVSGTIIQVVGAGLVCYLVSKFTKPKQELLNI